MPLKLRIEGKEMYDEEHGRFIETEDVEVEFEHSLSSIQNGKPNIESLFLRMMKRVLTKCTTISNACF